MIHSRMETEGYSKEHYKDYSKLLLEINRLMQKGNIIIAIDGGSASGKTTLSKMLEKEYSATVFHMDDFFLRPLQRTKERLATPGGNIDWERFLEEVLIPLKNNESISYKRFDCSTFTMNNPIIINPTKLNIVEGAYSMHPELAKYYDYSVFLDISSSMQEERIKKRNTKEKAKRFFEEWIPMENMYFNSMNVKERCDVVVEIMEKSLRISETMVVAKGKEIYIKGYMPDDDKIHPAVILSHGYNGCHADFERECTYYAENGFVAYAIDFCGGSTRSKSTGKSTDMTLFTEKEDLLIVFDYVSKLDNVDEKNIFLFGGSQGGLVTVLAAEELKDKVKGIALYYPAINIPDDWRGNFKTVEEIPEEIDFWGLKLGREFFTSMREFYPFEIIGKYPNKIFIIHGDNDPIVKLSVAEKTSKCYSKVEIVVLEGEGHGFSSEAGKVAMEKVLEFMKI